MKILVLNCGSSSLKYQLIDMPKGQVEAKGLAQRIGEPLGQVDLQSTNDKVERKLVLEDHTAALKEVMDLLLHGPLDHIDEIKAVGHRVVHGGERFSDPVRIDDEVIAAIEAHIELAPLHNPANLVGIQVSRTLMPTVPQVAVFDTAFHQTMPAKAYRYALPESTYKEARVRRYGFHGTSHQYVAERAAEVLGKKMDACKLITAHLGNGASISAIDAGKSVDTSMGLTPLEGLVMGTRCGDIDPAIIFHLARTQNMDLDAIDKMLNKKSGLLGLSGQSNDLRTLEEAADKGDENARLAIDVFAYRIKKYIGAYLAALNGADALIFTAGIGENSASLRAKVCEDMQALGIEIDVDKNAKSRAVETDISSTNSRVRVLVIPTNEELAIAQQTYKIAG